MVNALKKGRRFERFVAKLLSKTFKIPFHRVPMSGAFQTQKNINNPIFKGDVFTEDEEWNDLFNVVIECKTTKRLPHYDFDSVSERLKLLLSRKVQGYLEQCKGESKKKNFWLFIKEDYKPIIVIEGEYDSKKEDYTIKIPLRINHFLRVKKRVWEDNLPKIKQERKW